MNNCLLASSDDGAGEAFSHDSSGRHRAFALFWVGIVLALAFSGKLAAQPTISSQPQNQSAWGGTVVVFSVDVGGFVPPLPPLTSGTLQLWLKADAGVVATNGALVSQWQDQSTNGNDAFQTETNQQPLLVYPVRLGSRPALRFDGVLNSMSGDYLVGTGNVGVPNAMTAFTVYNAFSNVIGTTDWGAVPWLVGSPDGASSRGCAIFQGGLDFTTFDANYLTPFIVPTNTYRICTDRVNTNLSMVEIFDDTASTETNFSYAMAGESAPPAGYYVGAVNPALASYGYSRCFDGDIAEIIIYQGYLSEPDRLAVLTYLQYKYYAPSADGAVAYQWRFNGTNITGATNASLILTNVQPGEEGSYSVVVTNSAGSTISSNALLDVKLVPIVLTQPTNQTVFSFEPVTFSVAAEGPVPLQYQWTFDGAEIPGATNSAFVLSNVPPSEVGTYAVIVGTEPNVTVSSNAVLSVYPPNEIVSNLSASEFNIAVQAGGTVTFATNGTIVLTNTITISNNVILDGTNHSITISGGGAVEIFNLPASLSLTLRNLTVANGLQNGDVYYPNGQPAGAGTGFGGAIFTLGNLDIENCTFTNNGVISPSVPDYDGGSTLGGAIYNSGTMTISNTTFVSNAVVGGGGGAEHYSVSGSGYGGAIYNNGGTISLGKVMFSNNAAVGGAGIAVIQGGHDGNAYGGAIFSTGGVIAANDIEAVNNAATGGGTDQSIGFPGGVAFGGSAFGGAVYLTGGTIAFSNSIISNNVAGEGGGEGDGGAIVSTGSVLLWNCDLEANIAQGSSAGIYVGAVAAPACGGAIYNTGSMQIIGTTISNSCANGGQNPVLGPGFGGPSADGSGGGIYNTGSLIVEDTTLLRNISAGGSVDGPFPNSGNGWGGAIYNTGFVQLSSTILSSNTTSGLTNFGEEIYNSGGIQADANSSLIPYLTGTPPLSFQWQENGSNIVGSTNAIVVLGSAPFQYEGTFDLVISNGSGLVANFEEIVNLSPPLTISSVTPSNGITTGGTSVAIAGTGFTNGATVFFGDAAATSVTVVSATNITASTPQAATPGAVDVTIVNPDFEPVVLTNGFTYEAPVFLSSPQQSGTLGGTFMVFVGGTGISGYSFVIQSSTDLVNWVSLQTNSSPFTFTDTNAASYPRRFYRAVLEQ